MSDRRATRYTPWLLALWLGAIALGLSRLHAYGGTPVPLIDARAGWPDDAPLGSAPERETLLFFVHPRCPCTAASADELAALLRDLPALDVPDVQVIWREPKDGPSAAWSAPALRTTVARMPHVTIVPDPGGAIAQAFGATASGTILSFDAHAHCRYRGGITASRGHRGPSPARLALRAVLTGERTDGAAPVFGCPLQDSACPPTSRSDTSLSIERSR